MAKKWTVLWKSLCIDYVWKNIVYWLFLFIQNAFSSTSSNSDIRQAFLCSKLETTCKQIFKWWGHFFFQKNLEFLFQKISSFKRFLGFFKQFWATVLSSHWVCQLCISVHFLFYHHLRRFYHYQRIIPSIELLKIPSFEPCLHW